MTDRNTVVFVRRTTDDILGSEPDSDRFIIRCVNEFLGSDREASTPSVIREKAKKPRLGGDTDVYFSLSHSGIYRCCAVSRCEVGLDIQKLGGVRVQEIARRFFHPDEAEYIRQRDPGAFFDIWCAKESYVKYTGEGITDGFRRFSVVRDGAPADTVCGAYLTPLPLDPDYRMCLCTAYADTGIEVRYI